ncbi:MAG: hypothetical protein JO254_15240 [Pseudolabrys sp.]|nr:hypothetical protein [Pseudolabrys sp.]
MKTISAMTLVAALAISGAAFAQSPNNAASDNRADGAANTAAPVKGSNTGINANGDLNKDGVKVDAKAMEKSKSSTTGSAVKGDASTQGTAKVLHPEKNNEKTLTEQKK